MILVVYNYNVYILHLFTKCTMSLSKLTKRPKHSWNALIGVLDVLACHSKTLLASHEWLQLWRTNKTCSDNAHIQDALYLDVWVKMNKIRETPYLSFVYVRASVLSACGYGDDWLQDSSITLRQSPFGRFIIAIRREPVVRFETSKHAALTPYVYKKGTVDHKGRTTYQLVGRVESAKCDWVNVKATNHEHLLYSCDELYCRRDNISETEGVPGTICADDAQTPRPVDYYFQRRCTTCHRCLVVKQPAELFHTFGNFCREFPKVRESIAHEEREHQKTCSGMFESLERAIYS